MSETRNLLIEIGTEELPPKALKGLSEAFSSAVCRGLEQQQLAYQIATPYATPRRLAVLIKGVALKQADQAKERRGPALTAAFDASGQPTSAALGFARSCGIEVAALETLSTDKGAWLVHRYLQPGQHAAQLIADIINDALAALPIPKRMRWSDLPYEFVRPIHWVVVLLGKQLIETEIMGIVSSRQTRGHRFHHPQALELPTADDYVKILEEQGYVIPSFTSRRQLISHLVTQAAEYLEVQAVIEDALLDEVTSLVEWPVAVVGAFEPRFLQVPPEALIATLKNHQKCFHVVDSQGQLCAQFIAISNLNSTQPDLVRAGYERVIRPRLSDAAFFWQQDCTQPLETHIQALAKVIFQEQLGSLCDKSKRVAKLAGHIAQLLNQDEKQGIRAGHLAKCDLISNMVGEFPELQGIMGEHYARHDGETEAVAVALREHYMPRFWGDNLPGSKLGQALAIADKLDTLVGIFGIGQPPTGDKDPFALRRATLGILRIMIECQLALDIKQLLTETVTHYPTDLLHNDTEIKVFEFILERLRGYAQEQGYHYDTIDAVLACQPTIPVEASQRIQGLEAFRTLPEISDLVSTNKRIVNILRKATEGYPEHPDPTYFNDAVERQLYDKMEYVQEQLQPLIQHQDYQTALQQLASLQTAVNAFFDKVMVMDNDINIRQNRLALLQQLRNLFLQVADISRLQI